MPRIKETIFSRIFRKYIRKKMIKCINDSNKYFTISNIMKNEYYKLTNKESKIIMNMTESLYIPKEQLPKRNDNYIKFIYTGSLYYNRDKVIGLIAKAADIYNKDNNNTKKIKIEIYSNSEPSEEIKKNFEIKDCCEYCGSLTLNELKVKLNIADILIFVESFEPEMKDKTKYSLSTKVPEYLSVGKPIFAVGPQNIGSMEYLDKVAFCVYDERNIYNEMVKMLRENSKMLKIADLARKKFEKCIKNNSLKE